MQFWDLMITKIFLRAFNRSLRVNLIKHTFHAIVVPCYLLLQLIALMHEKVKSFLESA